jgi:hypothetical protein
MRASSRCRADHSAQHLLTRGRAGRRLGAGDHEVRRPGEHAPTDHALAGRPGDESGPCWGRRERIVTRGTRADRFGVRGARPDQAGKG